MYDFLPQLPLLVKGFFFPSSCSTSLAPCFRIARKSTKRILGLRTEREWSLARGSLEVVDPGKFRTLIPKSNASN